MKAFRCCVSNTFRLLAPDVLQRTLARPDTAPRDTALASLFSLFGGKMRLGYPNLATGHLLDALLAQHRPEHVNDK